MALTPKDSETFYREVDEELRRDQMRGFFARYGIWLIALLLLFLAGVAGYLWWENHNRTQAEQQGEELSAMLDEIEVGRTPPAGPELDKIATGGNDGYRAVAAMLKAGLHVQEGKEALAIPIYGTIVRDEALPQSFRDAALVRQTVLEYDGLKPEQVIERLKPLAVQGNPWFGSAGELVGIAYMRQGKAPMAAPIFAAMAKDEEVPPSIRVRAAQMASSLGVDVGLDGSGKAAATKEAR